MSTLQIGLAIAGGLALAAVVAHGAWDARRRAPRQAQADAEERGTSEPALHDAALDAPAAHSALGLRRTQLDALIDVITPIALDHLVSGEAALAALPSTRRAGSKPYAIEGLNAQTQVWETPASGQRYSGFQAGVQLANRLGALNEIEYSEYVVKTHAFADAVGGTPQFPEMRDEVARARELDQFASAHDAQLGFCVRARSTSWSPGYIQQHVARHGFVPGAIAGRMLLASAQEGLPPLLVLNFDAQAALAEDPAQSAIRELSLHLDVAQVARAEQPFARMRTAAQELAQAMDGVVTDDRGQVLLPQTLDAIAADLESLYLTLEQRDLAAGSALARRLFS